MQFLFMFKIHVFNSVTRFKITYIKTYINIYICWNFYICFYICNFKSYHTVKYFKHN